MTATNHALTGAVIAIVVKRPEIAIPLAFLSHFALDLIPHYNPAGLTRDKFKNYADSWSRKMEHKSFRFIFTIDMFLFAATLFILPFLAPTSVSPWTVFFSALAGAAPDFDGGIRFLLNTIFHRKTDDRNPFIRFHISLQWMERLWGIFIELIWFSAMLLLLANLIS